MPPRSLPMQLPTGREFMPFANLTGWAWDFGDPASGVANSSNQQNPSHTYAAQTAMQWYSR
ncbi:MAG: hypothetical protein R2788_07415 [Saprospiraceae bacterium]